MSLAGRVVVLGGYGQFGARIARALARHGHAQICIAGRSLARARRLVEQLERDYPGCGVAAVELDHEDPGFVRRLGRIAPIVVVHAAGPFQAQGYGVAEACLACRSHYVDLADARRFVAGFGRLDRDAARRDVLLVSGASTLPGVSSAVVDALAADMSAVVSIETAIVPANRTVRGTATLRAVLGYCGRRVSTLERGRRVERTGWLSSRTAVLGGAVRRVAVCDVPDLELFPEAYAGVETVSFHAGPELAWQHHALRVMAALARVGLVRDWSRYAGALGRLDAALRARGTATGAMQVRVAGESSTGRRIARTWDLVARQNHGPEIPCAPATALAKKLLAGAVSARGARPCIGLVSLDEIAGELEEFDIEWQVREEAEQPCRAPI